MMNETEFSKKFCILRIARGMTQEEFAEFVDLSRPTIGFYERGERVPDVGTLRRICEECHASADWLIGSTPEYQEPESSILNNAVEHFGKERQVLKCIEELSELQIALCREPIGRSTKVNIAEEIADVRIMLQQMEIIFGVGTAVEEFKRKKLARLKSRIESGGRTNGEL